MNIKDIEKEFDRIYNDKSRNIVMDLRLKDFLKEISNQIIDEMIGEEKDPYYYVDSNHAGINGYNAKVQELKDYKEKFNR